MKRRRDESDKDDGDKCKRKKITFACTDCAYETQNKQHFVTHRRIHTGEKPYVCDFAGCDAKFAQSQHFIRHKRTHTGEKPYVCDFPGCEARFSQSGYLTQHKRTHTGEKPYVCNFIGCEARFSEGGSLIRHKRSHTGDKSHVCDFEGCDYKCSIHGNLIRHKRVHTGEKPYSCDFPECEARFSESGHLTTHKRTHTGEKPYVCDFIGCKARFSEGGSLVRHKRTHTGEKPYICDFDGCDYKSSDCSALARHKEAWHTKEGIRRRKREEEKIEKLLKQNEIPYQREVQIDFQCALGTDRGQKFARIDFVIHRTSSIVILLEVDEREHSDEGYQLSCECRRMTDTYSSLIAAQPDLQYVIFIRYNPHPFSVNGVKQNPTTTEKHTLLLDKIRNFQPTKPFEVMYINYTLDDENVLRIFHDVDFPPALKPHCSFVCNK
jgi:uncharacterized Zn-finger protein